MIEHLVVGRSAYFYRGKRRLSQDAIDRLFRAVRAQAAAPSQNLFRFVRSPIADALYSAICFSYERPVAFFDEEADVLERVFGFLMIIEKDGYVAVVKSGLDIPAAFKTLFLGKVPNDQVERAVARHDAIFEQLRLKNMSTSKLALRTKSFEASDLENNVPTASANRFVAQGYRVRLPDGTYSATPSTGRISTRADRADHQAIVTWVGAIIDLLGAGEVPTAAFIRNFARPLDLDAIPRGVHPTFVAVDVPSLTDALLDADATMRLVEERNGTAVELTRTEVAAVLQSLDESFPIRRTRDALVIANSNGRGDFGRIKIGKSRIALQKLLVPATIGLSIEDRSFPLGADPNATGLARHIDRKYLFTIIFNDIALAYVEGSLFRDEALVGGGENFLRHLVAEPMLANANSEKGAFAAGQTNFANQSVFRIVVDAVANDCDILVCDDLGDEWADFIGLSTGGGPRTISFFHAKHGARSLGASPFHEAVGQAMKNLGRMSMTVEAMPAKYASWAGPYRNSNVTTAISRLVRGGPQPAIEAAIDVSRQAPDLVKRVYIVTSSLSRGDVEQTFTNAANGIPPPAHFVQLYSLLTNYFAACVEMGAIGYVICQP